MYCVTFISKAMPEYKFMIILMTVMFLGFILQVRGGVSIFHLYVLFHSILVLATGGVAGNGRYILPILPLFVIYFVIGLKYIIQYGGLKFHPLNAQKLFCIVLTIMIISSIGCASLLSYKNHTRTMPSDWENYSLAADWIGENSNEDDVIICPRPREMYLYSNRKGIRPGTLEDLLNWDSINARYVVVMSLEKFDGEKYYASYIQENKEFFKLVYSPTDDPITGVYEIRKRRYCSS